MDTCNEEEKIYIKLKYYHDNLGKSLLFISMNYICLWAVIWWCRCLPVCYTAVYTTNFAGILRDPETHSKRHILCNCMSHERTIFYLLIFHFGRVNLLYHDVEKKVVQFYQICYYIHWYYVPLQQRLCSLWLCVCLNIHAQMVPQSNICIYTRPSCCLLRSNAC